METTTPDYPRGVTFEEVWAALQDVAERQKETDRQMKEYREQMKETERILKEAALHHTLRQEETDQQMKEYREQQKESERERKERQKESEREWKEYREQMEKSSREWDRRMGNLTNRFGELAEHLVAPGIEERFNQMGYHFYEVASGGVKIVENKKIKAEIDLLLQNDSTIIAVEVKVKPDLDDINDHIKRLEILSEHRRDKNDHRKVEGAIAGAIFGSAEKKAAIQAGLYVITQSGDTMKIEVPDGFVPRKW